MPPRLTSPFTSRRESFSLLEQQTVNLLPSYTNNFLTTVIGVCFLSQGNGSMNIHISQMKKRNETNISAISESTPESQPMNQTSLLTCLYFSIYYFDIRNIWQYMVVIDFGALSYFYI